MQSRRVLLLALLFLAGAFAVDRVLGLLLASAFERLETGEQAGLANYGVRQTDAEIVVFGSSRAVFHVDPALLEEALGLSAFNAGAPGQGIAYARGIQSLLLERGSRARLFLLQVDPKDLWGSDPALIQRLAPFYGESPALDALLESASPMAPFKLQVATYRYNSMVFPMLANLLRERPSPGNGYRVIPADRPQDLNPRHEEAGAPGPIREDMSALFADFIRAGRVRGVQVALVDGPRWTPRGPRAIDLAAHPHLESLAREHGAEWILLDASAEPRFAESRYFADSAHLNREGAAIFSQRLAERLAPLVPGLPGE